MVVTMVGSGGGGGGGVGSCSSCFHPNLTSPHHTSDTTQVAFISMKGGEISGGDDGCGGGGGDGRASSW